MDCSSPGSSVHGISQARTLEWLPFLSPGDLPHPQIKPASSAFASGFFTTEPPGNPDPGHLWGNTSFHSWPLCAHETRMMDLLVDLTVSEPSWSTSCYSFPSGLWFIITSSTITSMEMLLGLATPSHTSPTAKCTIYDPPCPTTGNPTGHLLSYMCSSS